MKRLSAISLSILAGCIGLPLAGVALTGKALGPYLEFPPITRYVRHAGFSMAAFSLLGALFLTTAVFIGLKIVAGHRNAPAPQAPETAPFPWWGWAGLAITLAGWAVAWSRFQWMASLQRHTFPPLWFGYILTVNGLCIKRTGRSLLTDAPGRFALFFPASALFWWYFEYLNRFIQNWYYLNVETFTPMAYFLFATLAFSTVLPAVLSTTRFLMTFPIFRYGLRSLAPVRIAAPRRFALWILVLSGLGLGLIGVLPDFLFPLLWVSPLLIITALQALYKRNTIFSPLALGDWRKVLASALGALICGFFWEMWNMGSLAKWEYAIPYVHCCKVFEMPLLGFMGYLPFGLECLAVGELVGQRADKTEWVVPKVTKVR